MESMRCSVRCLSHVQFGCASGATTVLSSRGDVLLSNGSTFVIVCSCVDQKAMGIYQFPGAVRHMMCSNKRGLYALCENDGICYIDLPQHPRVSSSSASVCESSGVPKAPPCIRVIKDPCATLFLVVNDILVTVGPVDNVWLFKFYQIPELTTAHHRMLAEHCIPIAPADTAAEAEEKCKSPVLCCVFAYNVTSMLPDSEGHYFLESTLFALLFGIDVSLVSAPVVICGLPDGRICYLPFLPPIERPEDKHAKPHVKLLHSLEQPIVFVGTSCSGDAGGAPRALVVVGHFGKVLVVQIGEKGAEGKVPVFREYGVPGPVACACISNTHLYYSTLFDLLALPLVLSSSLERATEENLYPDLGSFFPNPISLNVSRLIALAKLTNTSTGAIQLVAMSLRGKSLCITLPQGSNRGYAPRVSARQAGQKARDLLTGIGNMSDRATLLKSSIQTRNAALKKVNQVFNVCCQLLSTQKGREVHPVCKKPVSVSLETKWIRLLQQDSLTLQCTLKNSSSYVLEQGWTLYVQMIPLSGALDPEGSVSTKTYSFPLKILFPGKNMEVVLPLASGNKLILPLKVTFSLVYSLQSVLGPLKADHLFTDRMVSSWLTSDTGYISLDLDTATLDWLDCLQVTGPTGDNSSPRASSTSSTDILQTFLNARRGELQDQSSSGPRAETLDLGPFVVTIRVSAALLSAVLKNSGSLCSSLLTWLFSSCPGYQLRGDLESPVVFGCCPQGNTLRLMAKEVLVEDLCSSGPILAAELKLESSSLATLCGLHYSVLRRIQPLLKEVAMETEGPAQLQGQSLRQALERAEALLGEIQGARGTVETPSMMKAKLLHVYQQLRTKSLLVL